MWDLQEFVTAQIRPRLSAPLPSPPPPRPMRNRGGLGSQELKSAQEHPGDNPRGALARASVSPLLSLAGALRVSPVPSSPLVGGFFFSPQSFSSSPLPLPRPSDRSAPPAPSSSRREEFRKKGFPEVWIRGRTGRPREEEGEGGEKGRGRRERE